MMGGLTTQTCGRSRGVECGCRKEVLVERIGRGQRRGNEEPEKPRDPSRIVVLDHRLGAVTHCAQIWVCVCVCAGGLGDDRGRGEVAKMKKDIEAGEWS